MYCILVWNRMHHSKTTWMQAGGQVRHLSQAYISCTGHINISVKNFVISSGTANSKENFRSVLPVGEKQPAQHLLSTGGTAERTVIITQPYLRGRHTVAACVNRPEQALSSRHMAMSSYCGCVSSFSCYFMMFFYKFIIRFILSLFARRQTSRYQDFIYYFLMIFRSDDQ